MASTSTNKQPMMVDRPFLRGATINSATATIDPVSPEFGKIIQLVRVGDVPSEDAAVVEDIFVVSNEGYPDDGGVRACTLGIYVYAPNQSSPSTASSILINKFIVGLSGSTEGLIQRVELPKAIAPTPQTGFTIQVRPIELGAAEAMYLEKGYILGVGYLGDAEAAASGGLSASGLSVWAQGGFY